MLPPDDEPHEGAEMTNASPGEGADRFEPYRAWLQGVYAGRKWIVAADVLSPALSMASRLAEHGAEPALCVAASRGTMFVDPPANAPEPIVLDVQAAGMMEGIRASLRALADLPRWAVERVDVYDPDERARSLGMLFDDGSPVAGRAKYGARPPAWQALEDKTTIDALWDAAGVARAPSRIVAAELASLRAASAELDQGSGCVWAGDNRGGFHGAATHLRWVRSEEDAREAAEFLSQRCDGARVMPFLEGVPCSIHGLVLPDRTLAFRPCEMLVFRRPGRTDLQYAQAATFWDPLDEDREVMRALTRQVGDHLRRTLGYRGFFTLDGVMTVRGFLPTELNPRIGAALSWVVSGCGLSMSLLNLPIIEGERIDWDAGALESLIVSHADAHRAGGGSLIVQRRVTSQREQRLGFTKGGALGPVEEDDPADFVVVLGPAAAGGFLRVIIDPERAPIGPSIAPRVLEAIAWADSAWQLGIGPLEPAPEVRR